MEKTMPQPIASPVTLDNAQSLSGTPKNFGVDATYELLLPDQNIPALETALTELTDGAVLITRLDDDTMPPETP